MIGQSPTKIGQEQDYGVIPESEQSCSSTIKSPEVIVMKHNPTGHQKENLLKLNKNSITFARNQNLNVNKTHEFARMNQLLEEEKEEREDNSS